MPLTATGEEVLRNLKKRYGPERGRSIFYASINAGKPGTEKWHEMEKSPSIVSRHARITSSGKITIVKRHRRG